MMSLMKFQEMNRPAAEYGCPCNTSEVPRCDTLDATQLDLKQEQRPSVS